MARTRRSASAGIEASWSLTALLYGHAPAKDDQVLREFPEVRLEILEMVGALGEEDRRVAVLEGPDYVIEDQPVADLVAGELGVEILDTDGVSGLP